MRITFRLRNVSDADKPQAIQVRLILKGRRTYECNSGFVIKPKHWKDGFPKTNSEAEVKKLFNKLKELESYLYFRLHDEPGDAAINTMWLKTAIKSCFNRVELSDNLIVANHVQTMIDTASTRKVKRNGKIKLGWSKNTIKNYSSFLKVIKHYQEHLQHPILFTEVNHPFVEAFTNWLINDCSYTHNYGGKILDILKSVCTDADKNEIAVNPYSKTIQHFRTADEDRYIQTLSFDELEQIKNALLPSAELDNARKWIVIGCAVGQRGGDLLKIDPKRIECDEDGVLVTVNQQKGGKEVVVGIFDQDTIKLLTDDFPVVVNQDRLNELIKEVCKTAGITEVVEGLKLNPVTNRKEFGRYPKFELITTHCFRRSFATNNYKRYPVSVLMAATGHTKESTFLTYINKREDKDANAKLFIKLQKDYQKQNPHLKVV